MEEIKTTTDKIETVNKPARRRGIRITEGGPGESQFFSVSIRGIITLTVVYTVCGMSIFQVPVSQELWFLAGTVVGWYFGQKDKGNEETKSTTTQTQEITTQAIKPEHEQPSAPAGIVTP